MLKKTVNGTGSGPVGSAAVTGSVDATLLTARAAANTPVFERDEVQARRLRRQLRLARAEHRSPGGWAVRTW